MRVSILKIKVSKKQKRSYINESSGDGYYRNGRNALCK